MLSSDPTLTAMCFDYVETAFAHDMHAMQVQLVSGLRISCVRALGGIPSSLGRTVASYLLDFAPAIFICIGGLYAWLVHSPPEVHTPICYE